MAGTTPEGVPTVFVPPQGITLQWSCDNEDEHDTPGVLKAEQPLSDVPYVGGAICPECGEDMTLVGAEVAL